MDLFQCSQSPAPLCPDTTQSVGKRSKRAPSHGMLHRPRLCSVFARPHPAMAASLRVRPFLLRSPTDADLRAARARALVALPHQADADLTPRNGRPLSAQRQRSPRAASPGSHSLVLSGSVPSPSSAARPRQRWHLPPEREKQGAQLPSPTARPRSRSSSTPRARAPAGAGSETVHPDLPERGKCGLQASARTRRRACSNRSFPRCLTATCACCARNSPVARRSDSCSHGTAARAGRVPVGTA